MPKLACKRHRARLFNAELDGCRAHHDRDLDLSVVVAPVGRLSWQPPSLCLLKSERLPNFGAVMFQWFPSIFSGWQRSQIITSLPLILKNGPIRGAGSSGVVAAPWECRSAAADINPKRQRSMPVNEHSKNF